MNVFREKVVSFYAAGALKGATAGPVCFRQWEIFRRFNNFCTRRRFCRTDHIAGKSGRHGLFHQGKSQNRLAVHVCRRCSFRIAGSRLDFKRKKGCRRPSHVGGPFRTLPRKTLDCRFSGRHCPDVRSTSCRWVTERTRSERSGSAGSQWLCFFNRLLPGRYCGGTNSV